MRKIFYWIGMFMAAAGFMLYGIGLTLPTPLTEKETIWPVGVMVFGAVLINVGHRRHKEN